MKTIVPLGAVAALLSGTVTKATNEAASRATTTTACVIRATGRGRDMGSPLCVLTRETCLRSLAVGLVPTCVTDA
jgi:hypothetical protein